VREGEPHVGLTDDRGQVTFFGADLRGPVTVTAFAESRSAETYVDVDAREVTLVLSPLPMPPCDPADPACAPPPPPPTGVIIGFLTGLEKIDDPPPGATIIGRIEATRYSPGFPNPDPGPGATRFENGAFSIVTRLGEQAVFAQCGWLLADGTFVVRRIGVTRGGFIRDPAQPWRTSLDCSIRLDQPLTVKLASAPPLVAADPTGVVTFPSRYRIEMSFELGADGHIETLPPVFSTAPQFTVDTMPPLVGPLDGALVDFTASAMPSAGGLPLAQSYLRRVSAYDRVWTFPPMLALPEIITPALTDRTFERGYIEWLPAAGAAVPDFYQVTVSSGGAFPRWSVFVPAAQNSVTLAAFPEVHPDVGWVPGPGAAESFLSVSIRAIAVRAFEWDTITRYALRQSNWEAASVVLWNATLDTPSE